MVAKELRAVGQWCPSVALRAPSLKERVLATSWVLRPPYVVSAGSDIPNPPRRTPSLFDEFAVIVKRMTKPSVLPDAASTDSKERTTCTPGAKRVSIWPGAEKQGVTSDSSYALLEGNSLLDLPVRGMGSNDGSVSPEHLLVE